MQDSSMSSEEKVVAQSPVEEADNENCLRDFVMEQVRAQPDNAMWNELLAQYVRCDIECRTQKATFRNVKSHTELIAPIVVPLVKDHMFPLIEKMIESGAYTPSALAEFLTTLDTLKNVDKKVRVVVGNASFKYPPERPQPGCLPIEGERGDLFVGEVRRH